MIMQLNCLLAGVMLVRTVLAGGAEGAPAKRQNSDQDNHVFFPPENDSPNQMENYTVRAGDLLNITWATSWSSVDLSILAFAPDSNFTVTPFFNSGLSGTGFFPYRLQPHDYYNNNTNAGIQAFYQITHHDDQTEFVKTQNFTINHPDQPDELDDAGIPLDATTWTGSVTLVTTVGQLATTVPAGATAGAVTAQDQAAGAQVAGAAASSAPQSETQSGDGAISTTTKIIISVSVAAAVLLLGLLVVTCVLISRRKRREAARNSSRPSSISSPSKIHTIWFNHDTGTWEAASDQPSVPSVPSEPIEKPAVQSTYGELSAQSWDGGQPRRGKTSPFPPLWSPRHFTSEMPNNEKVRPEEMSAGTPTMKLLTRMSHWPTYRQGSQEQDGQSDVR